jgi:hypothetical protein
MENKPIIQEVFADNGEHSHWTLIDPNNGEKLWSADPEECKAMGYPVISAPTKAEPAEGKTPEEVLNETKKNHKDDWTEETVIEAMQSYASQQTAEAQERIRELERVIEEMIKVSNRGKTMIHIDSQVAAIGRAALEGGTQA